MTPKKLTAPGHQVQHAYMLQCLRLVHEFGALRVLTIAYAMFPKRAPRAAHAAAERVVSNAHKLGYLECAIQPDSKRYYALTLRGARVLNSFDDGYRIRSTKSALDFHRHEHREWCNLVTLAARHRGLHSKSEAQITGAAHRELVTWFGHVPDALTYFTDADDLGPHVAWHEVELSRRSTSGTKKLGHLVQTLIDKRYLTLGDNQHIIDLVMHCATDKIERENRQVIRAVLDHAADTVHELDEEGDAAYAAQVGSGAARRWFLVYIDRLPETVEGAWDSTLPWPGAPGEVTSDVDVFLRPAAAEPRQAADPTNGKPDDRGGTD